MARRPALVSLLACIPLLVGQPAIADMVIEVTNYSRIQVGVAVSGSNILTHLLPGGPPHAFPASGGSRNAPRHDDRSRPARSPRRGARHRAPGSVHQTRHLWIALVADSTTYTLGSARLCTPPISGQLLVTGNAGKSSKYRT